MNEETIIETNAPEVEKQRPINKKPESQHQKKTENQPAAKKKKGIGIAGIAGAAGLTSGVLIPKQVFPSNVDDNIEEMVETAEDTNDYFEANAPYPKGHITGHDMDVATGVDDSMSFNQAFAAAREEVGAGGLFVWHGHTYGTYYANEWNSMSPEDKEQYWADVHHTTSHINDELNEEPADPTIGVELPEDPISPSDPDEPSNYNDPNDPSDRPSDGDVPSDPPGGWDGNEEPTVEPIEPEPNDPFIEPEPVDETILPIDDDGVLHLNEEQVNGAFDTDWDGITDGIEVDVNGNDVPDLVIDYDGDGTFDTLEVDVDTDGSVAEIHTISDVDIQFNDEIDPLGASYPDDDIMVTDEPEPIEENPDIDILADNTLDNDIPLDNDMDMSEFA